MKLLISLIITTILISCSSPQIEKNQQPLKQLNNTKNETEAVEVLFNNDKKIEDTIPITKGEIAKILAYTFFDNIEIETSQSTNVYDDIQNTWYEKYVNVITPYGYMNNNSNFFKGEEKLTLQEAQNLLDLVHEKSVKIKINDKTKDKPVSYALWVNLYLQMLKDISPTESIYEKFNIKENNIIVLATNKNNEKLENIVVTDKGPKSAIGIDLNMYLDKEIKVLEKNGEIICVVKVEDYTPTIKNNYITSYNENEITIFVGGVERSYLVKDGEKKDLTGLICDIKVDNGVAKNISIYTKNVQDTILKFDEKEIEFKNIGFYTFDEDFKVYDETNEFVKWKHLKDMTVGTDKVKFIVKKDKLIAGIINKKVLPTKIRVVLNNSDYNNLYHDKVVLTSSNSFKIVNGEDEKTYNSYDKITIDESYFNSNRIYVIPENTIEISNIKRNWSNQSPKYSGVLEIEKTDKGFIIVNEIEMEQYLYAVVPSEMPSSYGVETSKIQAITARSYAYNQYYQNRYRKYGGHVDDSVSSQVYNNIPPNDISIEAVNSTNGKCITYNGKVVSANFFSTSAGVTANSGEVWAKSKYLFPTYTENYLTSVPQYKNADFGDLSKEENAYKFFKSVNVDSYENSYPWFRWNVKMDSEEISTSINNNIEKRYNITPYTILTLQQDNTYKSEPITNIGLVTNIEVLKRGKGGNIMELKVVGTNKTIKILTEYNIRYLIKPYQFVKNKGNITLTRNDNSKINNYSLMPSAFYVMDINYDENGNLIDVIFSGGGNGHGVGLSQNGANEMVKNNYSIEDIISHYYSGTKITKVY